MSAWAEAFAAMNAVDEGQNDSAGEEEVELTEEQVVEYLKSLRKADLADVLSKVGSDPESVVRVFQASVAAMPGAHMKRAYKAISDLHCATASTASQYLPVLDGDHEVAVSTVVSEFQTRALQLRKNYGGWENGRMHIGQSLVTRVQRALRNFRGETGVDMSTDVEIVFADHLCDDPNVQAEWRLWVQARGKFQYSTDSRLLARQAELLSVHEADQVIDILRSARNGKTVWRDLSAGWIRERWVPTRDEHGRPLPNKKRVEAYRRLQDVLVSLAGQDIGPSMKELYGDNSVEMQAVVSEFGREKVIDGDIDACARFWRRFDELKTAAAVA